MEVKQEQYIDLETDRVYFRLPNCKNDKIFKILKYPSVVKDLYLISEDGIVINRVSNTIVERNNITCSSPFPSVNLSCIVDGEYSIERFRICDLMASTFIRNSELYLERGCKVNCIGNEYDTHYTNFIYDI